MLKALGVLPGVAMQLTYNTRIDSEHHHLTDRYLNVTVS
jgi:hypothetical protein